MDEFINILAHKVTHGVTEMLKDAKSKGKTLDDVIAAFEAAEANLRK